jgi:adenosylcobinamide kinase/adenosylcobinamide-phosphate guanylyltransferase
MAVTFVLGGARSGKSAHAQKLAEAEAARAGVRPLMIATAEALDAEMEDRIARHRADRGAHWRTLETPVALAETVRGLTPSDVAVIDCLTLGVSNLLVKDLDVDAASQDLAEALAACPAEVIVVSNETGLGLVPDNALARRFRDAAGRLNQLVAQQADRVSMIFAGQVLRLKPQAQD